MAQSGILPFEACYVNSCGVRLYLDRAPFIMTGSGLFDTHWRLGTIRAPFGDGCRLISSRRFRDTIDVTIEITADSPTELARYLELLSDTFDYDIIGGTPGQLFICGQYLRCWCSESEKKLSCDFDSRATLKLKITPEAPVWITEKHYHILPAASYSGDGLSYPYSYPKRYGAGRRMVIAENTHFSPSPVMITFYGPTEHPRLHLGTQCMGADVTLEAGEYAVIDQRSREIFSVSAGGEKTNCFDLRDRGCGVFTYLPPGSSMLTLESDGGADIILYEQRSEPLWTSS